MGLLATPYLQVVKGHVTYFWNFGTPSISPNFGDDRFRGFWGSGVRIYYFCIDLRCRP